MSVSFVDRKLEIEVPAEVAWNVESALIVLCTLEFIVKANCFFQSNQWELATEILLGLYLMC